MDIMDTSVHGYCMEILNYLIHATKKNQKQGCGIGAGVTLDITPVVLLFNATNASSGVEFLINALNEKLIETLPKYNLVLKLKVEDDDSSYQRIACDGNNYYTVVKVPEITKFSTPGQFVSLYLLMRHIKSTMKNDKEFVKYFGESKKWLKVA
ncbi:hypothetical protein ACHAXS_002195 [Conticribra weissflogii]